MKKFTIKTGKKERLVYRCSFEEYTEFLKILFKLNFLVENDPRSNCVHGFIRDKSPLTNAKPHIGFLYTISLDLENFFESVTRDKVEGLIAGRFLDTIIVDGCARQGLPTSPQLSNLAFLRWDDLFSKWGGGVYTRYADDLTYSCNSLEECHAFKKFVQTTLEGEFKINKRKTKIQYSFSDWRRRRIITGVSVGKEDVRASKKLKRKVVAAHHKWAKSEDLEHFQRFNGLIGWADFLERQN